MSYIFSGTLLTDFVFHSKSCVFIIIYAVNMAYFLWGEHVNYTYDRNNENLETITNKIKYIFDKMEGVALISHESIQIITTNLFFKVFICITLITFYFFLLLKTIKHIKHSNYMDMQNLHKTFEREKT